MKFKSLALMVILCVMNSSVYSRQYIQCAFENSWDRLVINLNGDESTLFMTTGVHDPNEMRILKNLFLKNENSASTTFATSEGEVIEEVTINNEYLNRANKNFPIDFKLTRVGDQYSNNYQLNCFSSIFDD